MNKQFVVDSNLNQRGATKKPTKQVLAEMQTVAQLVSHYAETEMTSGRLAASTCTVYRNFIKNYIVPAWGNRLLSDIRAVPVESWLGGLDFAPSTKSKIRNIFSALFQHAKRQEWAQVNPIRDVRQGARRLEEPDILVADEIRGILGELSGAVRLAVLLAAVLGLRQSEISGLQWQDIDCDNALIHLRRGIVNQQISELKTAGSKRPMPIPEIVLQVLEQWKAETRFSKPEDWIFASEQTDANSLFGSTRC